MKNEESKVKSMNVAPRIQSVHTVAGLSSKQFKLGEIIHKKLNSNYSRSIVSSSSDVTEIYSEQDRFNLSSPRSERPHALLNIKENDSIYTLD
jgi:hypothetical protein